MSHRPLSVGVFSPSVLLRVARSVGLLQEHGVSVTEVQVESSPDLFRDLLDGTLDAAFTSPDNVIAYRFTPDNPLGRTGDARILAALDHGLGLGVYARPGVTAAVQLRGTTVGVDAPGSGYAFGLYAVLESLGLRPPGSGRRDYAVRTLGGTPRRLSALLDGRCAATVLGAGSELLAEDAGATRLAGLVEVCGRYLGTVLTAVGPHGARAARPLAEALARTAQLIVPGELDATVLREARTALGLTPQQAARHATRLRDPDEGLVPDGTVDLAALRTVLALRLRHRPDDRSLATALEPERGLLEPRTW
ncbi:ABC transporter substrate-binding protein [Streptomyces sp. RPT161]|uniref:ABC transporter substrate-binding protein n=1 Tax=Streptomyces sp. RPT161 TaxID=3015993 RepID=UPI0022B91B4A|nr:hypothetical protein [Streptomyces sp. RPT161]